ncbi:MAG: TonB-dependent receptor [Proteobacteria bacterium]|nr:TonB-dependent receptor [Pseudomonadota bacterium]
MSKTIRITALSLALSTALHSFPVSSATGDAIVLITATRFQEPAPGIAANISIITRGEIEHSPARSVPDLLKAIAGLDVRPLYGSLGIDATVDIRGSGEAAGSNTLILVDGQRLNPVDSGSIKWETIPLSAIRQIEVMRGSGAVLYGDRAAAGVINIITDKSDKLRASVKGERGSFGYAAIDASLAGSKDNWQGNLFAHDASTDGYRVNSDAKQTSAGGRAAYRYTDGEAFMDFSGYREQYGLPGTLSRAQYESDPRQSTNPNYRLERDGYRVRPGATFKVGSDLKVDIDGSVSDDTLKSKNADWYYRSQTRVNASALSPRLKWTHGLPAAESSETIAGLDLYDGKATADDLDFATGNRQNRQTGQQSSRGIYFQNLSRWKNGVDTTVALRRQHFEQKMSDAGAKLQGQGSNDLTAWELGASYAFSQAWRAYLKTAKNFRLPNTDELFAYDPLTYKVYYNGALNPQTGQLVEGGLSWTSGSFNQQFSVFQQSNKNEIGYIADNGRNANLDPTRRRGAEWEGRWQLADAWTLRGSLTAIAATFDQGIYSGKNIPLVPRHKETLGGEWDGGDSRHVGIHSLALVSVGSRYFGGDFGNVYRKMDGYTTLDYQGLWNFKPISLILRATNLTDRKYSATGFSSAFNPGTYYPADPRSFSVALKAEFF